MANLWDYLDTGLFLDHRPLRKMVEKESQDKKVLNLFSYTCAISTTAAIGGARQVTSIDLSPHYLEWGKRNFELNNTDPEFHEFIQGDILQELPKIKDQSFDFIICDPPTFSNSKKMNDDFDVQDAHPFLIDECLRILRPGGPFIFQQIKESSSWITNTLLSHPSYGSEDLEIKRFIVVLNFNFDVIHSFKGFTGVDQDDCVARVA